MANTIAAEIRAQIDSAPGRFWQAKDFPFHSAAVVRALSRLHAAGSLKRMGRGLYYNPKKTVLGDAPPSTNELIKRKARSRRFVLAGLSAFHWLGLTTQVPAKNIYAVETPIDVPGVEFILRNLSRYGNAPDELIMILDMLGHIESIPDCTPDAAIQIIEAKFKGKVFGFSLDDLARVSLVDRPKVRAIVGLLGDVSGLIANDIRAELKASLNPLTRFKVTMGTTDKRIAKIMRDWHIG